MATHPADDGRYAGLVESLVESMLYGRKVLIRTLPQGGRTALLDAVEARYRAVTGVDPLRVRPGGRIAPEDCVVRLRDVLAAHGTAAVLLDDWEDLLSEGGWQPRLNAVCVDGPEAPAVGVLITTRAASRSSLRMGPESPLVDAVNEVRGLPLLSLGGTVETLLAAGVSREEVTRLGAIAGCHPQLVRGVVGGDLEEASRDVALEVAAALGDDGVARLVELARKPGLTLPHEESDERLMPAIYRVGERVSLAGGLLDGGLLDMLAGSGASWPEQSGASLRRLTARLLGGVDPLWFDRYLVGALPELLDVLDGVVPSLRGAGRTLRLLSGPPRSADQIHLPALKQRIDAWRRDGVVVCWHGVDMGDLSDLHARQVIYANRTDGYTMPPADRIIGRVPPGNENDAYLSRAPVRRVREAWKRSKCWCCAAPPNSH